MKNKSVQYKMGWLAAKFDNDYYKKFHMNRRKTLEELMAKCPYKESRRETKEIKNWRKGYNDFVETNDFIDLPVTSNFNR